MPARGMGVMQAYPGLRSINGQGRAVVDDVESRVEAADTESPALGRASEESGL